MQHKVRRKMGADQVGITECIQSQALDAGVLMIREVLNHYVLPIAVIIHCHSSAFLN